VRDKKKRELTCWPTCTHKAESHPDILTRAHTHTSLHTNIWGTNEQWQIMFVILAQGNLCCIAQYSLVGKVYNPAIVLKSAFTKDASLAWVKNQRNMQQIIGNIFTQNTVYMSQCFCALCLQGLWEYLTASWTDEKVCSTGFMCPASPKLNVCVFCGD